MVLLKRIGLFLVTNIAVLLVISLVLRFLGIDRIADSRGNGIDVANLLVYSAVVGFTGSLISLAMSKWIAKRFTGAVPIVTPKNETEAWLMSTVQNLATRAGIGMPEVAVYQSPDMNAFATGARKNHALVAVSTGLLQSMNRREVEAVLGHEISHVANGDMVTLALLQGVVNTFVVFLSRVVGEIVDRTVFRTEKGRGAGFFITTMVSQILLGILASMIVAWFSRRREFRADAGSAKLLGTAGMIAALERLQAMHDPARLPDAMRAFAIRGGKHHSFIQLLSTHPPLELRIAALRNAERSAPMSA